MLVIDALRITISIPILFAPIKAMNTDAMNNDAMNNDAMNNDAMNNDAMNNDDVAVPTATYLIDGGVYSMYPIEYCIDIPMDDIIGILLLNCGRTCQITDFASYVYTLIQSLAYKEVTALLKKYKSITHCIKSIEPISLAISMTANSKEKLYQLGIETRPAAIVRPAGGAQFLTMSS
jgi:pentapeptide MXKDX repeat protein